MGAGDILFIDSTHVSKIDSDVNYIFFKILPALPKTSTDKVDYQKLKELA